MVKPKLLNKVRPIAEALHQSLTWYETSCSHAMQETYTTFENFAPNLHQLLDLNN